MGAIQLAQNQNMKHETHEMPVPSEQDRTNRLVKIAVSVMMDNYWTESDVKEFAQFFPTAIGEQMVNAWEDEIMECEIDNYISDLHDRWR